MNLDALAGLGISTESTKKANNDVGQEDFLKLMIAQLQNQDPFNPMDNGEFLTQIATFTTATGINQLQASFSRFQQDMANSQALYAASLVGREVKVESTMGYLPADGEMTTIIGVPENINNLTIRVYSSAGELVYQQELGEQEAGEREFRWDGIDQNGRELPPGRYYVSAQTEILGEMYSLPTYAFAKVQSVTLGKGGEPPFLNFEGLGELSLAAVRNIR